MTLSHTSSQQQVSPGQVSQRLAKRPRIASVALEFLHGPLAAIRLPALSTASLATGIWRRVDQQFGFTGYALRPLAYAVYQRYLTDKPVDLAEEFSFLTLHPGSEYPQRAQVDQSALASEIDLAGAGLIDAWCERLTRYWSEPQEDGTSFWAWLAQYLRQQITRARQAALTQGLISLREAEWVASALALAASETSVPGMGRQATARVLLEDASPVPRLAISVGRPDSGWLLYSPFDGFSRFDSLADLEAHLVRPLGSAEREPVTNAHDLFHRWAYGILDRHLSHLRALAVTLRQQHAEPALFESRMNEMPAATLLDHANQVWRSEAMRRHLPDWLRQANEAQRLCYADGLKALIQAQASRRDAPLLGDIPTASQFASKRLIAETARLHPEAPLTNPEDVVIHIHRRDDEALLSIAGGGATITFTEQRISLVDFSLVNVGGRPRGWMSVGSRPGKGLPGWLDEDAATALVVQSNVGATYLSFLREHLAGGGDADKRRQTYRTLAAAQLPLLALELHLRRQNDFDERGVDLVRRIFSRSEPAGTAAVTQLALRAEADLPPDPIAGVFILSDLPVSDVLVLYSPLGLEPLRQFSSRRVLHDCILSEPPLRQAVLNGLSDTARDRYTHGGLEAPRWARFGIGDEFAPLPAPRPAQLAELPIGSAPLDAFYDSVVEVITRTADRQTVSNWESFWMSAQQVSWLAFNQLLPLFSGVGATAAWLIQLSYEIDAHYNDAQARAPQPPDEIDSGQVLLDLMLALVSEGFHLTVGKSAALEGSELPKGTSWHQISALPLSDLRWSTPEAELTPAMREQLNGLAVAAPVSPPVAATEGVHQGLYLVEGQWLAPVGDHWFRVHVINGDIRVVDPTGAERSGPWLRPVSGGQWQVDLRLRLRGGGPKRRIDKQREENQRLRAEASQHLTEIERVYRKLQQVGGPVEAQIKADLDAGNAAEAKARHLAELERVEHAYADLQQACQGYEAIHAKVALADYHERLSMALAAEINTCGYYLSLNRQALKFFLAEHPAFSEILRDGLPMSLEQRTIWFEFLRDYVHTVEAGVSWRSRLEDHVRRLEEVPIHGARWLDRLKPKFASYRPLIEYQALRLYTQLSVLDAPMVEDEANLQLFHQAMKPLVLALNTHKQMILDPDLGVVAAKELLDGVVNAYQGGEEMVQVLKHSLRPEYVTPGMDRLREIISEQRIAAENWLGRLLVDAQAQAPEVVKVAPIKDPRQRVIRTRNRGPLVARVRKKPGHPGTEIAEVISPLDDRVVARFEPDEAGGDWVERAVPAPPRKTEHGDINRLAQEADRRLADAARQLAQAPRLAQATHIPIELEELLLGTAHDLNALAEKIERSLTQMNETDVAVEGVQSAEGKVRSLRTMAASIKREARALRVRLTKMALPTVARVRYLVEEGEAHIRRLGGRVALKGQGKRKDLVQEYVVEEPGGTPLWYAHFHYANAGVGDQDYLAAHLKTVSQRFVGLSQQMAQAADNAEVVKVYRSRIDLQSARALFLNQP
ncbi:hypothetical protein [Pseudomonas massiliensis]|uniref:hypothetical protein n=1 Tax=Pseudomonas massiliensis TaxID=522492 RepID=UPI000591287F|nr:hypothetical protein [Pseudomonas massiliensis]